MVWSSLQALRSVCVSSKGGGDREDGLPGSDVGNIDWGQIVKD